MILHNHYVSTTINEQVYSIAVTLRYLANRHQHPRAAFWGRVIRVSTMRRPNRLRQASAACGRFRWFLSHFGQFFDGAHFRLYGFLEKIRPINIVAFAREIPLSGIATLKFRRILS